MMSSLILTGLLALCLVFTGWASFELRKALKGISKLQEESRNQQPAAYQDLSRQVAEIHQTMGGVIHSLKTMGTQVHHLNTLADHAIQEAQAMAEEDDEHSPRILIELRPHPGDLPQHQPRQAIAPEDMSPEMLEKFKTFQSVYQAIMQDPEYPSRKRPDLN